MTCLLLSDLFQTHQEQGRSYKEVCAPVIERLRFLFNELRPAVSNDLSIVSKLKLLSSQPRWRRITQKLIRDRRKKRGELFKNLLHSDRVLFSSTYKLNLNVLYFQCLRSQNPLTLKSQSWRMKGPMKRSLMSTSARHLLTGNHPQARRQRCFNYWNVSQDYIGIRSLEASFFIFCFMILKLFSSRLSDDQFLMI